MSTIDNSSSSFWLLLMTSFRNIFIIPYNKNWQWFIAHTKLFSALENETLHSAFSWFPVEWLIGMIWHPFLTISWSSGFNHDWHLFVNDKADGGQNSLIMHIAISRSKVSLNVKHGPWSQHFGTRGFIIDFQPLLGRYILPSIEAVSSSKYSL